MTIFIKVYYLFTYDRGTGVLSTIYIKFDYSKLTSYNLYDTLNTY